MMMMMSDVRANIPSQEGFKWALRKVQIGRVTGPVAGLGGRGGLRPLSWNGYGAV